MVNLANCLAAFSANNVVVGETGRTAQRFALANRLRPTTEANLVVVPAGS
ncbi:uncharacterized protein PHALS_14486 [Plasmopara halstedii]|uniref:Uncharacterized protein n=1 Tax=Plasmopara halstedii TaxID=4781 RepID=A0A0N7L6G7_PLAHL|nr:uncharacterized protein PHALS_14486 [Plasmopara halstedii]CEG44227.1 hypothetical protein PHALS_14486 [Plasmopara halstedii]|eukprot:XP_024580596.1 hypothetical protein PHALS_14486 [Plasmopara halstedii]